MEKNYDVKNNKYNENSKHYYKKIKNNCYGLKIYKTIQKSDGDIFYTVVNPENNAHVHLKSYTSAVDTCRCFNKVKNFKCLKNEPHYCRIQALTLFYNMKIK